MKKFFKWLLVLLAILAIFLVVLVNNPAWVKGPVERQLSDIAGYPVNLEGELDLNLGRQTEITAQNIHVSGPDWATHRDLLTIGQLKVSLVTGSLFKDIIILESLSVDNLQLNLETDTEGKGNWISADAASAPDDDANGENNKTVVVFSNIEVSNTTLSFQNGKTGVGNELNIESLSHHQQADGMMHTTLTGDLNERPVEYTGNIGPYENLLNGKDISYDASGHFGELKISSDGHIDDLLEPKRPRLNLDLQGPNIDEITAMLGVDDLGSGELSLRAQGAEVSGHYEASIRGNIGDISLDASAQVSDLSELDSLDLKLAANGPSLGSFTRAFGVEDWPDKPFSIKGDVNKVGGTLNIADLTLNIGGTELILDALLTDFPNLDASRIKLSIEGDDIAQFRELVGLPGATTGPFSINGKLDISVESVELVQVEVVTSLGQATFSGVLGPAPDYIGSKLQLHMNGNNARSLMSVFGIDALPEQAFNVNTRFELLENGIQVERSVLVTIDDDRLELGGFIAFEPGVEGSEFDIKVSGNNLAEMLQHVVDTSDIPRQPYDLSGRLKVMESSLGLENVKFDLDGIRLGATGSVSLVDQLVGSGLDFQISGEDFSTLGGLEIIGDSLDMFTPGQPYRATGRFMVETNGWKLSDIEGQLGKTNFNLDGLISKQDGLAGSSVSFSIRGPGLNQLLVDQGESSLHTRKFESSGQVMLSEDRLSIQKLDIETDKSNADIVLDFGWPISSSMDVDFNLKLQGSDIRQLLPNTGSFKPEKAEFRLETIGEKRGKMLSLERFTADIGNLQITTIGEIDEDPDGEKIDLSFSVVSSDISKLGQVDGKSLPALPLDLKADFTGNAQEFILQNLDASLGESRLEGLLDVSLKGSKPDIRLTAKSSFLDLRPFIDPGNSKDPDTSDEEDVDSANKERLIPATPLPLDALAAVDVLLSLNITEVKYWKDSVRNLVVESEIKTGHLVVPEFSFEAPNGTLRTSFSIQPTGADQAVVKIDLDAEKLVLNISGQPKETLHLVPALNLDFKVAGKGSNLREVAGSANGAFHMESSGGTLKGVNLSILDTFILDEIFSLVLPKSSQKDNLTLKCAATILNIKDGVIKTSPGLAFTTDQIAIIAKGSLDLKTEKMHFNFNATPTNALKISASELFNPYILVGGTLSKPDVGIDPGKAILHGGAAIGTAGISVLAKGLLDRVGNAVPLCEEMQATVRQGENQSHSQR